MRKIKLTKWKVKDQEGKEVEDSILSAIKAIISLSKPEELNGLEKFQIMGSLAKAFDSAEKEDVLKLEEREYKFIVELLKQKIPANWGFNNKLTESINNFMDAKEE